jgi:hypothetical protein
MCGGASRTAGVPAGGRVECSADSLMTAAPCVMCDRDWISGDRCCSQHFTSRGRGPGPCVSWPNGSCESKPHPTPLLAAVKVIATPSRTSSAVRRMAMAP